MTHYFVLGFRILFSHTQDPNRKLVTLGAKLIKIGAKVVRHGRYFTFQLAQVAIPRAFSPKSYDGLAG